MEITRLISKLHTLPFFSRYRKDRINVFISVSPSAKGGGSNTFSYNFKKWLLNNKEKYNLVYNILKADRALIIADKANIKSLRKARNRNCYIMHRLDEHVEQGEGDFYRKKHSYIKSLNALADITIYQSRFVFENMHPYLGSPKNYKIILNGGDRNAFYPAETPGNSIGHITWGVGDKKRLDIVYKTIRDNPDESFLLIGNHSRSEFDFEALPNVRSIGQVKRGEMLAFLHQMKFLFFPSENDPCPNTVVESILSGVPVCFNPAGGTKEIVRDCGLPIHDFAIMLKDHSEFRKRCLSRNDLDFDIVADNYMSLN